MLLFDGPLTFQEYMTRESIPLARVFGEVLRWLAKRRDAVLFGAQAVNAYCEPPRMTEDVDLLSTNAAQLAEELCAHLARKLHIAARVREVVPGGFRVFQVRKPKNRHLVDVRQVSALPAQRRIRDVQVATPAVLAAMKVQSIAARRNQPKGDTDRADLRRLLLRHSKLKVEHGEIYALLESSAADERTFAVWRETVRAPIEPDQDDRY